MKAGKKILNQEEKCPYCKKYGLNLEIHHAFYLYTGNLICRFCGAKFKDIEKKR